MVEEPVDGQLEVTTPSGKPPKPSRLNSASSAFTIVSNLIERDQRRSLKRSRIQGQIDGNPPYSAASLKRQGQGNRSNVNFRQAESIRDSRKTSYYELLMEVEKLVEIIIPEDYEIDKDVPQIDYGEIIAEEFTKMLQKWEGFYYHTMLQQEQFVMWGFGNCYWPNPIDWRFKAARMGSFLVPDNTKALLKEFELIAIRTEYSVSDLFEKVQNAEIEAAAKAEGWNTELIKELLHRSVEKQSGDDEHSIGEWESLQAKIKENDLAYSYSDRHDIKASHLLYQEFDGTISHMVVVENAEYCNKETRPGKQRNWLFRKIGEFEEWKNAARPFFAGVGEGTVHSIRGLGAKIYTHCVINDRLLNTTLDGAMASATILLQPTNDAQKERIRMVRVGPFSVMPAGYNVIQHGAFQPNLQGLVGIHNLLSANLNQNVGVYRPDVVQDEKTPQSQNQAELRNRATKEAKLEKSDIHLYYLAWDALYEEILRKALSPDLTKEDPGGKEAKAMIDRCVRRGVPEDLLKFENLEVEASRAIGIGSPVMRGVITADLLSISPYYDERGKDNVVRDYIAARGGWRSVRRYKPSRNRNEIPTNDTSIAALENNDLREGSECAVGVDQPHVLHIITHMTPLVQLADAYVEGKVDPEQATVYFNAALRHISQHLDFIATDPSRQNEYKAFFGQFQELARVAATMEKQAAQIQQQRQKEEQANAAAVEEARAQSQDSEMQAKLMKVQGDLQLRVMKEQGNQRVRETKAMHGMQIKEMTAKHDMLLKNMEAERE